MAINVVPGTRQKFEQVSELVQALPVNEAIALLARSFVGSPYLEFSLDGAGPEQLRLDLMRFDCMLFVEQLLAIASAESFDQFAERTQRLRYRDGEIGYCTRQHYFHDWVKSAQAQGMLEFNSEWPGQRTRRVHLNYMSSHRDIYQPLRDQRICSVASLIASRGE